MNIFNKIKESSVDLPKIFLTIFISLYLLYYLTSLSDWHFIDNANLIFHEAGHIIFSFFGEFVSALGGTLMQIIIPIIFISYFYKNKNYFSSSLLLFWLSQNFFNISVYVGDAIKMELPLLGGDGAYHDWNYLLSFCNILDYTDQIASTFYFIGIIIAIYAIVFSIKLSKKKEPQME